MAEIDWQEIKTLQVGTEEAWRAEIGDFKIELEKDMPGLWTVTVSYPNMRMSEAFEWEGEAPFRKAQLLAGRLANARMRTLSEFCDEIIKNEERKLSR